MDHSYIFDWFLPFFIPYHLDGDELIVLVVQTLQDLPEGALPDDFQYLKPVGDVVVQHLDKQDNRHKSVRARRQTPDKATSRTIQINGDSL